MDSDTNKVIRWRGKMNMLERSWFTACLIFLCSFAQGAEGSKNDPWDIPLSFIKERASILIREDLPEQTYELNGVEYVKCYHRIGNYYGQSGDALTVTSSFYPMSPKIYFTICFYQIFEITDHEAHTHHIIGLGIPNKYKKKITEIEIDLSDQ